MKRIHFVPVLIVAFFCADIRLLWTIQGKDGSQERQRIL